MAEPAIRLEDVSKRFRIYRQRHQALKEVFVRRGRGQWDDLWALRHVSFDVKPGQTVGVIGENGAGKSTLLKLLVRSERATAGVVIVAGHDLQALPEQRVSSFRQQIGIVFQDIRLFAEKTIFENVALSLQVSGQRRRRKTADLVEEALQLVGLEAHARRFPHQISGGEQQRAAIARAIVRSPQLLIADEPTANLPPDASWQIIQLLAEINRRGGTVLVATHDREVVDGTRRRVVELSAGRIVRDQRYGTFTPGSASASGSVGTDMPVGGRTSPPFPLSDPERGRTEHQGGTRVAESHRWAGTGNTTTEHGWIAAPLRVGEGWPKAGGRSAPASRTSPSPDKRPTSGLHPPVGASSGSHVA